MPGTNQTRGNPTRKSTPGPLKLVLNRKFVIDRLGNKLCSGEFPICLCLISLGDSKCRRSQPDKTSHVGTHKTLTHAYHTYKLPQLATSGHGVSSLPPCSHPWSHISTGHHWVLFKGFLFTTCKSMPPFFFFCVTRKRVSVACLSFPHEPYNCLFDDADTRVISQSTQATL